MKRGTKEGGGAHKRASNEGASAEPNIEEEEEELFEDPFGDEFEEEEIEVGDRDSEDEDDDEGAMDEDGAGNDDDDDALKAPKQVWRPGIDQLPEGEELEYDPSAYIMYHSLRTEWPCLSFDILRDNLGDVRQRYPQTMYLVCGSQADKSDKNKLTLLKLSELHKTQQTNSDSENEENADADDLDEDPVLEHINIPHQSGVNRVRSMPQNPGIIATMAENGQSHIYDLSGMVNSLMTQSPRGPPPTKPAFTFRGHSSEGFALDWSPVNTGWLATGDCNGAIHAWAMGATPSSWQVDSAAFYEHRQSVEDIQWSPSEAAVFCSCSVDGTIKIWDIRQKNKQKSQISFDAHVEDINVISWNRKVSYLLASGCDDGSFKVWDLRNLSRKTDALMANYTYHRGPITSIEWAPHDESVICVSSADNQCTIWDLSVEVDAEASHGGDQALSEYPAQLLFIHQGQNNIKELHHHPQIPGMVVTTAEDGFNVFKPAISAL